MIIVTSPAVQQACSERTTSSTRPACVVDTTVDTEAPGNVDTGRIE
jgi:hypothetical protein